MVGLKVVETRCDLLELGPGARARRMLACAVRGGPDSDVADVLVGPSLSRAFLERTIDAYMSVLSRYVGSDEHVRVANVHM
jgi:hypothetical protein